MAPLFSPRNSSISNNFRDFDESVTEGQFKLLGEGGFGEVYKVRGTGVFKDSIYALKRLRDHHERDKRFEKEWQSLKLFNELSQRDENYRGIHIPLGRIDVYQEDHCIIMPWIEGQVLESIIHSTKYRPVEEREQKIIKFLKDTLQTLDLIHKKKYIHRDINPRNVIQNENGEFIIIDFGIVYECSDDEVSSNTSYETVKQKTRVFVNGGYSSQEYSPCFASDIYSLGAIAISWITLKNPRSFMIQQNQMLMAPPPDRLKATWDNYRKSNQINTRLSEIISKMVELTDGDKRYKTCQEVLSDLDRNNQYKLIEQHIQSDPPDLALANEISFDVIRCLAQDIGQNLDVAFLAFPPPNLETIVREVDNRLNNALQCQNRIFNSQGKNFSGFCQRVGWSQDNRLLSTSDLKARLKDKSLNDLPEGFFPFIFHLNTDPDRLCEIYKEWFARLGRIFR